MKISYQLSAESRELKADSVVHQVVVIGAGIAGLAAAWELQQQGIRPVILEQSARPGGVIFTERINGLVIDGGPDSLLVQKPAAIDLCRELGIVDRLFSTLPPRTAFVMRDNQLVALPQASFLGLPTRLGPFVSSRLFSWRGKLRMAAEALVPPKRAEDDESIGDFIRRRFGDEACEYLAEPLLAGIHAGDVDRLSIRALFPRLVDAERTHGSVLRALFSAPTPRSHQGAFVSFPGGTAELVDAVVAHLGKAAIQYNTPAARITGRGPYNIRLASGDSVQARSVIVATPAWSASTLLGDVDGALAALCGAIPYASSATACFAMRRAQVRHDLGGTGFVVPFRERRSLMAATWVSSKWPQRAPAGYVLMRGFLGGARDPAILDQSDAELAHLAFTDLARVLGISGQPELTRVYRWPRASAQYHVGHLARVGAIDERSARCPGLYVTGSGYRGTGIPDCVADGRVTARAAWAFLQRRDVGRDVGRAVPP